MTNDGTTWRFHGTGPGLGSLIFDPACSYELTVFADLGGGAVYGGQIN